MNIACIAGDPGGGNALSPVIEHFFLQSEYRIYLYAYAQSLDLWRQKGWPVIALCEPEAEAEAALALEKNGIDILLMGTSLNAEQRELSWCSAAQKKGIPTLALLDFWSNYAARFKKKSSHFLPGREYDWILPDCIAVPDHRAEEEMILEGIPAEKIRITGSPFLYHVQKIPRLSGEERRRHRQHLGMGADDFFILFATQPLSQMQHYLDQQKGLEPALSKGPTPEQAILTDLEQTLSECAEEISALREQGDRLGVKEIRLGILLHPREGAEDYPHQGQYGISSFFLAREHIYASLQSADVVVGIHSMILLEACYLGAEVLSYQPGISVDALPSNAWGWSRRLSHRQDLKTALWALLVQNPALGSVHRLLRRSRQESANPVEKIQAWIEEVVAEQQKERGE